MQACTHAHACTHACLQALARTHAMDTIMHPCACCPSPPQGSKSRKRRIEERAAKAAAAPATPHPVPAPQQAAQVPVHAPVAPTPAPKKAKKKAGAAAAAGSSPKAADAPSPATTAAAIGATRPAAAAAAAAAAGTPRAGAGTPSLSIAITGSIVEGAASHAAAAAVAGQVARAACIFSAAEVVVYDDSPCGANWDGTVSLRARRVEAVGAPGCIFNFSWREPCPSSRPKLPKSCRTTAAQQPGASHSASPRPLVGPQVSAATAALARLLQYLETPPYLRSSLTPEGSGAAPELEAVDDICPHLQVGGWVGWGVAQSQPSGLHPSAASQATIGAGWLGIYALVAVWLVLWTGGGGGEPPLLQAWRMAKRTRLAGQTYTEGLVRGASCVPSTPSVLSPPAGIAAQARACE